ncbi:MAG TPA: DUF1987 domain-containing protein [Bacteroidales bacterium]|nr:MAG: hypothetical protein BWY22_00674 [Bacteroidetes bacterium ADurb.Bin217]HOS83774.1 DUF1987 domain-containing protein [Bacteroidales bacterium]HPM12837.1 DUF1987 domain-containing protein [Bacteroidales bacterium]
MEVFSIKATEETPEITLNPVTGEYSISHRSLPENAIGFYAPVFDWIEKFSQNPPVNELSFIFNLEYFNTASAKQIAKILLMLEKLSEKIDVIVIWKYKKDDVDMMSSGLRFSKLLNMEFEIQEVE